PPYGYAAETLAARARALRPALVVLDYLQLCGGQAGEDPRVSAGRVAYVARALARDQQKLTKVRTLREKGALHAALDARGAAPNPTFVFCVDTSAPRRSRAVSRVTRLDSLSAERTGSWHNRFRGLLIRWERKAANYLVLCQLASAIITYQRA